MRVFLVVVGDPSWQLTHYGFGIWSRTDADIVALDRSNEGFSHSVAQWTFERRRPRFEPDVAGEAAGVAGDVAAVVIRKPFDRDGQAIDLVEPVLDGSHHQVAHVLAGDAAGSGQEAYGFPIKQSSANATRTRSPLSQPISKPSDGATGELFVKGGWGRAPGDTILDLKLEGHCDASGIQKMKPPTGGERGY
jgi:hypothetical protein